MTTPEERRRLIIELVTSHSGRTVDKLAGQLEVSESTIRRDLRDLTDRNLVERTHGGAVPVTHSGIEQPFDRRSVRWIDRKRAIAGRAAEEISEGQVVYLDGGTTTVQVAKAVTDSSRTVIVTNSPPLLLSISEKDNHVKMTGGDYRKDTKALVGPTTEDYIRNSNFDLAVIGVNGVEPNGMLSAPNESEAKIKQLAVEHARRTIVVSVAQKFGYESFRRFGSVSDVDLFITDGSVPGEYRELFDSTTLIEVLPESDGHN